MSAGFGGRDLALALSSQVGDAYSLRHTKDDSVQIDDEQKPKLDKSRKVLRYRKGVQPHFASQKSEEDDGFIRPEIGGGSSGKLRLKSAYASDAKTKEVEVASDPRLLRLQRSRRPVESEIMEASDSEDEDSDDSAVNRRQRARRRVVETEILEASDSESEDEAAPLKSDAVAAEPGKLGPDSAKKLTLKVKQAPMKKPVAPALKAEPGKVEEDAGDGSSESETDSSDSEDDDPDFMGGGLPMLRPKFVPKDKRKLKGIEEEKQKEEEMQFEQERVRQEERRRETRRLVALEVQREAEAGQEMDVTDIDSEADMPDDMDLDDDEVEYEKWKVRELRRLVRDKEERERREEEAREVERRRQMTDDEIMREDRALGKLAGNDTSRRDESKQKFMQKYYHKGAFFMDEESMEKLNRSQDPRRADVRKRDYTEATGFDKFNVEVLPEVIQRAGRKFGLRSQTKWTHLNAEDTTDHRADRLDVVNRNSSSNVFDAKRKKQRRQ